MTSQTRTQLKPCPFCGTPHSHNIFAHGFGNFSVKCGYCGVSTQQEMGMPAAIAVWNRRETEDHLRQRLQKAKSHLRSVWAALNWFLGGGKMRKPVRIKADTVLHDDAREAGDFLHQEDSVVE